ncbi:Phenylalanyl-tRNA synthetase beta-subunit [Carabus blaptoides fortunei]
MWPEIFTAASENRHELLLSGAAVSKRISSDGLDADLFKLSALNLLGISDTALAEVPDEIAKLVNLQSLLLHSNKLTKVTPKIGELCKLKILDLSRNELVEMTEHLCNLAQLTTLNLSSNKLDQFPSLAQNIKLSVLDLANNQLDEFPDICHAELVHLSEVKLNGNKIKMIPFEISVLPALKLLDLSSNSITLVPGELADVSKLKEINLKQNPVADKRLLKLIDQCRSKQVLDYVKQHCPKKGRVDTKMAGGKKTNKKADKREQKKSEQNSVEADETIAVEEPAAHKIIMARTTDTDKPPDVKMNDKVKSVRGHILCCALRNIHFDEQNFRKFIQMQTKLHDTICDKRNAATIATHDLDKLAPGELLYTACAPTELQIRPLARGGAVYTGAKLFDQLRAEAENLRREKKRNSYSGVHRYLYLLEGKPVFPCLQDAEQRVISFPPITNCEDTKISLTTKTIFVEVTSATSQDVCRKVLDALLRETLLLGVGRTAEDTTHHSLTIQRVKILDPEGNMKAVYPSRADLCLEPSIRVIRD